MATNRPCKGDRHFCTAMRAKVPVPFARSVFVRYTLRSLAANRVRTAVTVVGIALATGLLMAVLTSVTSLQNGLANQSRESGGVWQVEFRETNDGELQALRDAAGDLLDRLALRRDLGAAPFSVEDAERRGTYLSVLTLPEEQGGTARARGDLDYEVTPAPTLASGRLPERDGEIALDSGLMGAELAEGASELPATEAGVSADGPIEVGSTVTLSLGRRVAHFEDGTSQEVGAETGVMYQSVIEGTDPDGTPNVEPGQIAETLDGVSAPRSYTVVGFVEPDWSLPGTVAYVSPDDTGGAASTRTDAYFSTSCASHEELTSLVNTVRPAAGARPTVLNGGLLAYEGLTGDRRVFDSLGMFGGHARDGDRRRRREPHLERLHHLRLGAHAPVRPALLARRLTAPARGAPSSWRRGRSGSWVYRSGVALGIAGAAAAFAVTGTGWARIVGTDTAVTLVRAPVVPLAHGASRLRDAARERRGAGTPRGTRLRRRRHPRLARRPAGQAAAPRLLAPSPCHGRLLGGRQQAARARSAPRRRPGVSRAAHARRLSAGKARVAAVALAVSVALLVTAGVTGDMLSGATGAGPLTMTGYDLELVAADESDALEAPGRSASSTGRTRRSRESPRSTASRAPPTSASRRRPCASREGFSAGTRPRTRAGSSRAASPSPRTESPPRTCTSSTTPPGARSRRQGTSPPRRPTPRASPPCSSEPWT